MATPDERCVDLAEKQFGLIDRVQAARAGMTKSAIARRLSARRWRPVLPGVYRMAGAPISWEQSLKAATLWGGDTCAVSHFAAAALHGLAGFHKRDVHIQSSKRLQHPTVKTHRTRSAESQYTTMVKGIPVTSLTRTLIDLSASLSPRQIEKALDESIRRGMTDLGRLRGVLSRSGTRKRGRRLLRALIDERDGKGELTDSELEDKLIRLLRRRRLPEPSVHYNVFHADRWLGEVDFAYPSKRVAIEVHGYQVHSLKNVWENDQRRENELVQAGWKVLKATHRQLEKDPDRFIDALRTALSASPF